MSIILSQVNDAIRLPFIALDKTTNDRKNPNQPVLVDEYESVNTADYVIANPNRTTVGIDTGVFILDGGTQNARGAYLYIPKSADSSVRFDPPSVLVLVGYPGYLDRKISEVVPTGLYNIDFTIYSITAPTFVAGAVVAIYNNADQFIGAKFTDQNGMTDFDLPVGTYKVRFFKPLYSFPESGVSFSVPGGGGIYEGVPSSVLPAVADACRVYGWVIDGSGNPIESSPIDIFVATPPASTEDGQAVKKILARLLTDSSGYWYCDLVKSKILNGARYRFKIDDIGLDSSFEVPDVPSIQLSKLRP